MSYRDSRLPRTFDLFIIAAFIFVQWRITVRLLRSSDRRWAGNRRTVARGGVFAFNAFLILGYAFTFSQLLSLIDAPPTFCYVLRSGSADSICSSRPQSLIVRTIVELAKESRTRAAAGPDRGG